MITANLHVPSLQWSPRPASPLESFELAPTRDCDSLIATFAMFVARLARSTRVDLAFFESTSIRGSATLQVQLDPAATVAAMHIVVDAALARARAELTAPPTAPALPVGISVVSRLDDAAPTARLLTLVLSEKGAARWRFDPDAFSRVHVHSLADRFTALLSARATSRWSRAPIAGVPLTRPSMKSRSHDQSLTLSEPLTGRV